MISKKICLVGAYGVGKTSLVQRFLSNSFSDKYQTTVGVRIEKKEMRVGNQDITLILWDLAGEDAVTQVRLSYLRGTAGYILVADGTREDTLTTALDLQRRVTETLGELPFLLIVNKNDLSESWKISKKELDRLSSQGWRVFSASAKSGEAVEEVFHILAAELLV